MICPNCGEIIKIPATHHTPRHKRTLNPASEPNDREFARHLKRIRQIEDQETINPYPELLQDL